MLVKLGNVWVDPSRVSFMEPSVVHDDLMDSLSEIIAIKTQDGATRSAGNLDEFAAIINNAIGQTYGGGDEEVETTNN
jgi:hypothetical protein